MTTRVSAVHECTPAHRAKAIGNSQVCTRKWSGDYLRGLLPPRACTPCYSFRPLLSYPTHLVAWAPVPLPQSAEEHWAGSHRGDSRGRPPTRPPEGGGARAEYPRRNETSMAHISMRCQHHLETFLEPSKHKGCRGVGELPMGVSKCSIGVFFERF